MDKIATEQEVYNVGQTGTPITNKCCTKQRMEALGCTGTNGVENYQNNRLVPQNSYKQAHYKIKFSGMNHDTTDVQVTQSGGDVYLSTDNRYYYLHIPVTYNKYIRIILQINYSSQQSYINMNEKIYGSYQYTIENYTSNVQILSSSSKQSLNFVINNTNTTAIVNTKIYDSLNSSISFQISFVYIKN